MMKIKFWFFYDLLTRLISLMGGDKRQIRVLFKAWLFRDQNIGIANLLESRQKPKSLFFGLSNSWLAGTLLSPLLVMSTSIHGSVTVLLSAIFFMQFFSTMDEVAKIVIKSKELSWLSTLPIDGKAFLTANLCYIVHVNMTELAFLAFPPAVMLAFMHGLPAALGLYWALIPLAIACIFLSIAIIWLILKVFPVDVVGKALGVFGALTMVLIIGVFLLSNFSPDFLFNDNNIINKAIPVHYGNPFAWVGASALMFSFDLSKGWMAASAGAFVVPITILFLFVRLAGDDFLLRLNAAAYKSSKKSKKEKAAYLPKFSRIWIKSPEERIGFQLVWKGLFRQKGIFFLFIQIASSNLVFIILILFWIPKQFGTNPVYFLDMFITSWLSILFITQITDSPKSEWIFEVFPLENPGALLLGGIKAISCRFVLLSAGLIAVFGVPVYGFDLLSHLLWFLSVGWVVVCLYANWKPFRILSAETVNIGIKNIMAQCAMMILAAAICYFHYKIDQFPFGLPTGILVALVLGLVLENRLRKSDRAIRSTRSVSTGTTEKKEKNKPKKKKSGDSHNKAAIFNFLVGGFLLISSVIGMSDHTVTGRFDFDEEEVLRFFFAEIREMEKAMAKRPSHVKNPVDKEFGVLLHPLIEKFSAAVADPDGSSHNPRRMRSALSRPGNRLSDDWLSKKIGATRSLRKQILASAHARHPFMFSNQTKSMGYWGVSDHKDNCLSLVASLEYLVEMNLEDFKEAVRKKELDEAMTWHVDTMAFVRDLQWNDPWINVPDSWGNRGILGRAIYGFSSTDEFKILLNELPAEKLDAFYESLIEIRHGFPNWIDYQRMLLVTNTLAFDQNYSFEPFMERIPVNSRLLFNRPGTGEIDLVSGLEGILKTMTPPKLRYLPKAQIPFTILTHRNSQDSDENLKQWFNRITDVLEKENHEQKDVLMDSLNQFVFDRLSRIRTLLAFDMAIVSTDATLFFHRQGSWPTSIEQLKSGSDQPWETNDYAEFRFKTGDDNNQKTLSIEMLGYGFIGDGQMGSPERIRGIALERP